MSTARPRRKKGQLDVIARYGAFYHGDDEEFAHCFVLSDGRSILLFQGLNSVVMSVVESPKKEFDTLADLLRRGIPAGWPASAYQRYNFVTDATNDATRSEIAVLGLQPGSSPPIAHYYSAPPDSPIGTLVKAIAQLD